MEKTTQHVLAADVGGTHTGVAIFAHREPNTFEPVVHRTFRTERVGDITALLGRFLKREARGLEPPPQRACVDFAGPIGPDRSRARLTNRDCGFTAAEVRKATGIEEIALLNDFEAVGFGLEVLLTNRPEAFVRLSRAGRLPPAEGKKPTAVVLGAGTGLGTTILVQDSTNGRYRPIQGEKGHADFIIVEETDFRITQWIRKHINRSARQPAGCERIVSGPGLINIYQALSELEPGHADPAVFRKVSHAAPYDRPAIIVANADADPVCRKALDAWIRYYARVAKNCAIFPLAPGGVFLAGGIAAKILREMQSGIFMREFIRCDIPGIQSVLKRTPVFVVTDYRIGLYGCANVAVNLYPEMRPGRP